MKALKLKLLGSKISHSPCNQTVNTSSLCHSLPPHGLYSPWNSPGRNTGVGNLSLLQGIFPTQGSNPGPPHCRRMAQMVKCVPTMQETRVRSLGWENPLEKEWQPTPVLFPGKSHEWRSMVGYSPWGCKESDTTERLHLVFTWSLPAEP